MVKWVDGMDEVVSKSQHCTEACLQAIMLISTHTPNQAANLILNLIPSPLSLSVCVTP